MPQWSQRPFYAYNCIAARATPLRSAGPVLGTRPTREASLADSRRLPASPANKQPCARLRRTDRAARALRGRSPGAKSPPPCGSRDSSRCWGLAIPKSRAERERPGRRPEPRSPTLGFPSPSATADRGGRAAEHHRVDGLPCVLERLEGARAGPAPGPLPAVRPVQRVGSASWGRLGLREARGQSSDVG